MRYFFLIMLFLGHQFPNYSQTVTKTYTNVAFNPNFKVLGTSWPQTNNSQHILLQSANGYSAERLNENTGFAIIPVFNQEFEFFSAELAFSFEKGSSKKSYAGLLLQVQAAETGALIIEIKKNKFYRVRKISGNTYINVTTGEDGWIKSKHISNKSANTILVKTKDRLYDIYINNNFITTFDEVEFTKGKVGLFIGEKSKALFESLVIKTETSLENEISETTETKEDEVLQDIIIKMRESVNKKDAEIQKLKKQLNETTSQPVVTEKTSEKTLENMEALNDQLSLEIETRDKTIETLQTQIKRVEMQQQELKNNTESGDVILNLTKLSADQKIKIEQQKNAIELLNTQALDLLNEKDKKDKQIETLQLEITTLNNLNATSFNQILERDSVITYMQTQGNDLPKKEKPKKEKRKKTKPESEFIIEEIKE